AALRDAIGYWQQAVAAGGPAFRESRAGLAASHSALAALLARFTGRSDASLREYGEAIQALQPPEGAGPGGASDAVALARYENNLGVLEQRLGDLEGALRLYRSALRRLTGERPASDTGSASYRWQQARCESNIGTVTLALANKSSQ